MMRSVLILLALGTASAQNDFLSALSPCPASCQITGADSINWTSYSTLEELQYCNGTMLLDFALYNPLDDPDTDVKLYTCNAEDAVATTSQAELGATCSFPVPREIAFDLSWSNALASTNDSMDILPAVSRLSDWASDAGSCNKSIMFSHANGIVAGMQIGLGLDHKMVAAKVIKPLIKELKDKSYQQAMIQSCGSTGRLNFGMVVSSASGLPDIQRAVRSWSDAQCVPGLDKTKKAWLMETIATSSPDLETPSSSNSNNANSSVPLRLLPRADCRIIRVVSGDSCASLASACGISGNQFMSYNTKNNLCATLAVGQPVCCSSGTLPDIRPRPNQNGDCAPYTVVSGDYCAKIAASNSLTIEELLRFNTKTWAWTGCDNLLLGIRMCLSEGYPPMPAPVSNAVCGPQVPGTTNPNLPTLGLDLSTLNPCKLNACCNKWGQCGTTSEFCTRSTAASGNPGTSLPGQNGCISNCGMDIVNNGNPPSEFISVAYFSAWNYDRGCLRMTPNQIDKTKYTHVHYAFADITPDFRVDISQYPWQFEDFKQLSGIKRIISFGGWSFSTEVDTYPIFREGVTDANRLEFARQVSSFVLAHNLDGVDFDWEYPGAPDIPGIPAGGKNDGANYLRFLQMVRSFLPPEKSVSIAAPASYWYLLGFHPIKDLAPVINYMIYMTYDLHGQWDYGNKWASSGCPTGNCLRSHINMTETMNALVMITKAGMPSNKVIVGISSYGRSFKMAQAGCTDNFCPFTGPASGALPGSCTQTAGYIAQAEIDEIYATNPSARQLYFGPADSQVLVYNNTEWVAYMSDLNKSNRVKKYQGLNFGGVSDWAVDLQSEGSSRVAPTIPPSPPPCPSRFETLEVLDLQRDTIPGRCMSQYLIGGLLIALRRALDRYATLMNNGYDSKFKVYADYIRGSLQTQLDTFLAQNAPRYFDCTKYGEVVVCNNDPSELQGTIRWTLRDRAGFESAIAEKGIPANWYVLGERYRQGGFCGRNEQCMVNHVGYPVPANGVQVPDPKESISKGLQSLRTIESGLDTSFSAAEIGLLNVDPADVVDGAEIPVFMVEEAIKGMEQVVETAEDIEEEKRKQMILGFITALLFFIPVAGHAASLAGLTALATVLKVITATGSAAYTTYEVVNEPESAIFAILGALTGIRGSQGFKNAASARRNMSTREIDALSGAFKGRLGFMGSLKSRATSCSS
ncbi:hypothetical protein BDZ85DRAFT_296027 [Elsinoe ampelina]|uniref:chitinase n=1 Tax=Elsinoe ampelina TaxID=302913 RepID=A0A6A6GE24_9PEZI|nr:hypothetical protein BDZ85DRAFT_296027 [Elsinoe ampelina]